MLGFAFRFLIFRNYVKVDIWFNWSYEDELRCYYCLIFDDAHFKARFLWVTSCGWKKIFNNFLIGKWKLIVHVIKAYLFHELCFVYVEETFITLNLNSSILHESSQLLTCIRLFFSINFSYIGGLIVTHTCHLGLQRRVHPPGLECIYWTLHGFKRGSNTNPNHIKSLETHWILGIH